MSAEKGAAAGKQKGRRRLIPDFTESLTLFSQYRYQQRKTKESDGNRIAEAEKRLEQLEIIIKRVDALERAHARLGPWVFVGGVDPESERAVRNRRATRGARMGHEIELLTEAFYYFAARFCRIMRDILSRNFDPAGVRDVRNHLLEHPEGRASRALNPNFMYGADVESGPRIKPFGHRARPVFDRGLYVNAKELLDELLPRLKKALTAP